MHGCWMMNLSAQAAVTGVAAAALLACTDPPKGGEQQGGANIPDVARVERAQGNADGPEFRTADELLLALERADEGMVSLTGEMVYDRITEIQGDHQVNLGRLYFVTGLSRDGKITGQRRFAIRFDRRIIDDVVRSEESIFIFDGEWLVEKNPGERLYVKRQVVPPGESFDPLRIGEGPMPLPIGQKREDIIGRYNVELLGATDGLSVPRSADAREMSWADGVRRFVQARTAYQLKLVPHPEHAEGEDLVEIRLWYIREGNGQLLPRMARTVSRAGDVSLVRLVDVQVQMAGEAENPSARVPPAVLDTSEPTSDWHIQVIDWRGRAPAAGR